VLGLPERVVACLFDLDEVSTDTAALHNAAWTEMSDEYLRLRAVRVGQEYGAFDPQVDYPEYVDGKPSADGVRDFLTSRGIHLPEGHASDPPDAETVNELANRKNEALLQRIDEAGVEVFEGSRRYLRAARDAVFEDALAGVEAGRAGRFGFVVGVDRVGQAEALRAHGADVVVGDLAELLEQP